MRHHSLIPFFLITFLLTWGIAGLFIFAPSFMIPIFGELTDKHPLFYIAVWAPAIAALIMVFHWYGLVGLKGFLSRLLLWRASPYWWGLIVVMIPLLFYISALFKGGDYPDLFPFESLEVFLLAFFFMAIKGTIEEMGWRGVALPILQRRMAPIWAGMLLGGIWAFWHTPAFLLSGSVLSTWSFAPFFIGTVAISIIMTPLFNSARGSILLPALLHLQLINPLWPDVQPYDNWLMLIVAVVLVWFNREAMFSREGAVTEVVLKKEGELSA